MNPEIYSYIFPKLFDIGALDVYVTSILMKKNRPANKLSVLTETKYKEKIEKFIFENTNTIGIRSYFVQRSILEREYSEGDTRYGKIKIKKIFHENGDVKITPEYESCAAVADKYNISITKVYEDITEDLRK